jgi:hypothetical protein
MIVGIGSMVYCLEILVLVKEMTRFSYFISTRAF